MQDVRRKMLDAGLLAALLVVLAGPAHLINPVTSDSLKATVNNPFLRQLLAKISANEGAMIARNP